MDKNDGNVRSGAPIGLIGGGIILAVGIVLLLNSFITINPGQVGVVVQLGQPIGEMNAGFHWKLPLIQDVEIMNIQTQRMDISADAASKDLQAVQTDVAVNYHLDGTQVLNLFQTVGTDDVIQSTIIEPAVQESVRASTADFNAEQLITDRPAVKQSIDNSLSSRLALRGIVLETSSIIDFNFSPEYTNAIEQKQVAQQNALAAQNVLQQKIIEAEQVVAAAQGNANSTLVNAQAQAEATRITGDAQAYAITVKAQALKQNPQVAELNLIDKWNGQLPQITSSSGLLLNTGFNINPVQAQTSNYTITG